MYTIRSQTLVQADRAPYLYIRYILNGYFEKYYMKISKKVRNEYRDLFLSVTLIVIILSKSSSEQVSKH